MAVRSYFGLVLVFLGTGFLLQQLDVVEFGQFLATWWPMLILLLGALLWTSGSLPPLASSLIIVLGVLLQVGRLDFLPLNAAELIFPIVLIILGIYIMFLRPTAGMRSRGEDHIDRLVLFSGQEEGLETQAFAGGTVTTLFGAYTLDLRQADIDGEQATLDVTTAFGGTKILVPTEWKVKVTGLPLFGGWDNQAKHAAGGEAATTLLRVRGLIAFGGLEITT